MCEFLWHCTFSIFCCDYQKCILIDWTENPWHWKLSIKCENQAVLKHDQQMLFLSLHAFFTFLCTIKSRTYVLYTFCFKHVRWIFITLQNLHAMYIFQSRLSFRHEEMLKYFCNKLKHQLRWIMGLWIYTTKTNTQCNNHNYKIKLCSLHTSCVTPAPQFMLFVKEKDKDVNTWSHIYAFKMDTYHHYQHQGKISW